MIEECKYCLHEYGDAPEEFLFSLNVDVKYPFSFEDKTKELSVNGIATPTVGIAVNIINGKLELGIDDPYGESAQFEGYDYFDDGTLVNKGAYVNVVKKINFCPMCGRKLREV